MAEKSVKIWFDQEVDYLKLSGARPLRPANPSSIATGAVGRRMRVGGIVCFPAK